MIYYDNKYGFQEELGSGGFGRVFLAKDIVSGRLVAIGYSGDVTVRLIGI